MNVIFYVAETKLSPQHFPVVVGSVGHRQCEVFVRAHPVAEFESLSEALSLAKPMTGEVILNSVSFSANKKAGAP